MVKTLIIAEAGVNHNGSLDLAYKLVDEAVKARADIIKFQTFIAEDVVIPNAEKAKYQINENLAETQFTMLSKLELKGFEFRKLKKYCDNKKIEFMSTAFDDKSIELISSLDVKTLKIPSGEINNYKYLVKLANLRKPIILSTGMSNIDEVEKAIQILKDNGSGDITILHCTSSYPAPYSEVNLNVIKSLRSRFKLPVGYSDHTRGIEIPIAAVALGAVVIEKHFTLDRNLEGPDHASSIEPHELSKMVESIRNVEASLGNSKKMITNSERDTRLMARKSIVAGKNIKKGDLFTEKNLTVKRPGTGISPIKWFEILGKVAKSDISKDQFIEIFHF